MKTIVFLFVILATVFNFGESAVGRIPSSKNDKYPGKCYYGDVSPPLILSPGEKASIPGKCSELHCSADFSMEIFSCGAVGVPKGCKPGEYDYTKDYPACCPYTPICP